MAEGAMEKLDLMLQRFHRVIFWITCAVLLFVIAMTAHADDKATLSWTAPTQSCDGSPFQASSLAGFKIYYNINKARTPKTAGGCAANCRASYTYSNVIPINPGTLRTQVLTFTAPGTYSFSLTAIATDGSESCYSNEESKFLNNPTPSNPTTFQVSDLFKGITLPTPASAQPAAVSSK